MDPVPEIKALVDTIRAEAKAQGLNEIKLGEKAGVYHQTIHSWFYGKTYPSLLYLIPVAEALGMKVVLIRKEQDNDTE